MAALDPGVIESVINTNFKTLAEIIPAAYAQAAALAAQDAVAHQRMINGYREVAFAEATLQRSGMDVAESTAAKTLAESGLARTMNELGSQIAALQQTIKGAQTTPPVTVPPPAV